MSHRKSDETFFINKLTDWFNYGKEYFKCKTKYDWFFLIIFAPLYVLNEIFES